MTLQPLTVPERTQLIVEFLAGFSRRLSTDRIEQIANVPQTGNPLFLRALLDELRQFGEHDRLGERIKYYLAPSDPKALYLRILQRWEEDYGQELVSQSLSLLWASRIAVGGGEVVCYVKGVESGRGWG